MIIWSPFIMDELAGLRDSAPPTFNVDPTSNELAQKTGFITNFSGPDNVLSVFGSKDKTTPKRAFMYLVKKLNASYSIYQGSGHNDIITAPKYNDKFVEEIILFADNI